MATRTTISLLQLGPVIFGGTDGIISFLQGKGLLAQQLTCHRCSVAMNIARRASLTDGHAFRCPQCHTYTSLRSGSFFEKSRLPLQKWILLQGRSHRYGWPGFNRTTFQGSNHISANIHEFGGAPSRPIGSHAATVDRARDR